MQLIDLLKHVSLQEDEAEDELTMVDWRARCARSDAAVLPEEQPWHARSAAAVSAEERPWHARADAAVAAAARQATRRGTGGGP
jgi:hypothetical protein